MGTFFTPQQERSFKTKVAVFIGVGVGLFLATEVLGEFTVAAASLVTLVAGFITAQRATRNETGIAGTGQVKSAETIFGASAGLALLFLPSGPTVGHGVAGLLVIAGTVIGARYLGRRHQSSQPTETRLGLIVDAWGRIPDRAPAVVLLFAAVVLGGLLNMYIPFGPLVGVTMAVVAGCRFWEKAKGDAVTRLTVSETLAGVIAGGEWTSVLRDMQRSPIWSLELNDDGVPVEIVVPIPPGMPADAQPKVEDDIINRLSGWGIYSVKWHTGGPGGKRRAVIKWWPPLADRIYYDGRPADGRKAWLGRGKVNREMLEVRPDATVGSQEDVYLDFAETPHALIVGGTGGGKSVIGKTVMIQWIKAGNYLVICDPKRVGFNQFRGKRGVLKVATDRFSIRDTVCAARDEMEARYARMEETGLDNIMNLPVGDRPVPLLVFIDEMTEAMSVEKVAKDDEEGNAKNDAAFEIRAAISQIVRLGRAAGVHVLALTQRADVSDGIAGSTKNNLEFRVLVGSADKTARLMGGFAESKVTATPGKRGRGICGRPDTAPIETQFAWAPDEELDRFLAEHDLADEAVVYGDEGVTVLDAVAATQSEAERLEILRKAHAAGDLTSADAKALGFETVADVVELLAAYDARRVESGAEAAAEIEDAKVEAQLKRKAPKVPVTDADGTDGGDTTGDPGTPAGPAGGPEPGEGDQYPRTEPLAVGEAAVALQALIGLDSTKEQVEQLRADVRVEMRGVELGLSDGEVKPGHYVLAGPPGTGKTELARIIGSLLRDLGVLTSGHVIEVTPQGVKGKYVGHSGPKADRACDAALGGVLFIDEAYGLGRDQFGIEALEQIMVRMENDRSKFCVILAGYPKEMEELLDVNPGLRHRIPPEGHIIFPAYTRDELVQIAAVMFQSQNKILTDDAERALVDLMAAQDLDTKNWANARSARNLVNSAVSRQRRRLSLGDVATLSKADFVTVTEEDILGASFTEQPVANLPARKVHDADDYTPTYADEFGDDEGDTRDETGGLYGRPGVVPPTVADEPETPAVPAGGLGDWLSNFPDDRAV